MSTRFADAVQPGAGPAQPAASARKTAAGVLLALLWAYHFVIEWATYWVRKSREHLLFDIEYREFERPHGSTPLRDGQGREVEMLDCDEDFGQGSALRRRHWSAFPPLRFPIAFYAIVDEESSEVVLQDVNPLLDDARTTASFPLRRPSERSDRMVMALVDDADPHEQIGQCYAVAPTLLAPRGHFPGLLCAPLCRFSHQIIPRRLGAG